MGGLWSLSGPAVKGTCRRAVRSESAAVRRSRLDSVQADSAENVNGPNARYTRCAWAGKLGPMENTQQDETLLDDGKQIIYLHNRCGQCELPRSSSAIGRAADRRILDATGDIYVTMTRDQEEPGLWECDIAVYERNAPSGSHPVITHVKTVGQPLVLPPGCPPWMWAVYSVVGDMAAHFMDDHDG